LVTIPGAAILNAPYCEVNFVKKKLNVIKIKNILDPDLCNKIKKKDTKLRGYYSIYTVDILYARPIMIPFSIEPLLLYM
jgi:hypothetical protein